MKIAKMLMLIMCLLITLTQPALAIGSESNTVIAFVSQTDPINQVEVNRALRDWLRAIQTNDPNIVTRLYAEDAVLLPTLSSNVLTTSEQRRSYFTKLFTKDLPQAQCDIVGELRTRVFDNIAVTSGLYNFSSRIIPDSTVRARFSFVYRKNGPEWKIVEHHSSKLPV